MKRETTIILLTSLWFVLVLVGAGILSVLEGPHEQEVCQKALTLFNDGVANKAAQLTVDVSEQLKEDAFHGDDVKLVIMSEDHFDSFIAKIDEIYTLNRLSGILRLQGGNCTDNWSFANSLFNAGSMITSLGFSYTAPSTFYGKLFVSFYVIVGVPVFLMSTFLIAEKISSLILRQLLKVSSLTQSLSLFGVVMFVYSLITLVPAAIISVLESEAFFDSWYFASTTVTTVGFGDFRLSGVARAAWISWVYVAVLLQLTVFVLIYKQLTISEFEKSKMLGEDQRQLLDAVDGKARYGAGMAYRPTMEPTFYHQIPAGEFDEREYRTLSTMPMKLVDPQIDILDRTEETESIQSDDQEENKVE